MLIISTARYVVIYSLCYQIAQMPKHLRLRDRNYTSAAVGGLLQKLNARKEIYTTKLQRRIAANCTLFRTA